MHVQAIDRFHTTRLGYGVFGVIELGLAYLFGSLAINSGSIWEWTLTVILVFGTLHNLFLVVFKRRHFRD